MAWLMLAQAIVAASGPVAIESVAQAKAMSPQALADILLAPGHPPVDIADVAPLTMEAPPPPGAPPQFRVVLFTTPVDAREHGYCERMRIDAAVIDLGRAATAKVSDVRLLHRLDGRCGETGKLEFGRYDGAATMAVIRDLDRLRAASRPSIRVDFYDEMPNGTVDVRYRDGLSALRAVRLDRVSWAGPASMGGSLPDKKRWKCARANCEQFGFYADGIWSGVVTREAGRITSVVLERAIPAPF